MASFHFDVFLTVLFGLAFSLFVESAVPEDRVLPDITVDLEDVEDVSRTELLGSLKELMKETSVSLSEATGLRFGTIVIRLPESWNNLDEVTTDQVEAASRSEVLSKAHITVRNVPYDPFGKYPYAMQFGDCGQSGLGITVPVKFLLMNETSLQEKAKMTVREWIKDRYGVFNENGFPGDPRYPMYFRVPGKENHDIQITDCTNEPANYSYRYSDGKECDLQVDQSTGFPVPDPLCQFRLNDEGNENLTSSLMYTHSLANVKHVCGDQDHPHNGMAINKQNVLCHGLSIWDVLKQHSDFKGKEVKPEAKVPESASFRLIQERKRKIVLAVDISKGMKKASVINNAVSKFIYDLPEGTKLSVLKFFSNKIDVVFAFEELGALNGRNSLVNGIAFPFNKAGQSCPECAIKKALEVLAEDDSEGSVDVVLMAASNPVNSDNTWLLESANSQDLCLFLFLFNEATLEGFDGLTQNLPCLIIFDVNDGSNGDVLKFLYEGFQEIVPRKDTHYVLTKDDFSYDSSFSLMVDRGVKNLTIWLTIPGQNPIPLDDSDILLEFEDPSITQSLTKINTSPMFLVVRANNIQRGRWTLKLQDKADQPLFLEVIAEYGEKEILTVNAWTKRSPNDLPDQAALILYVQVLYGAYPIMEADVTATLTLFGSKDSTTFPLYDNGLGDPDITKNDGIYTRYITNCTTEVDSSILVKVTSSKTEAKIVRIRENDVTCCGSTIQDKDKLITSQFEKEVNVYILVVDAPCPEGGFQPSKILDLRVTKFTEPDTFTLEWSAPGGEKDFGNAEEYNFNMYENLQDAFSDSTATVNNFILVQNVTPADYAFPQKVDIKVDYSLAKDRPYFLTVKSVNKKGRISKVSNVVEVFVPAFTVSTIDDETTPESSSGSPPKEVKKGGADGKTIGIIIGSIIAVIILIACIYVGFYFLYMKPRRRRETARERRRVQNLENKVKDEEDPKINNDGTVPAKEWQLDRDPISPVNSVPANVLLYHHAQVKDAKKQHKDPPLFKLESLQNASQDSGNVPNGKNQNVPADRRPINERDFKAPEAKAPESESSEDLPATTSPAPQLPNVEQTYAKPYKRTTTNV